MRKPGMCCCSVRYWGKSFMGKKISVLPRRVKLGKNFIVKCHLTKPVRAGSPNRYEFSIQPVVPNGKKYRTYSTISFPGVVHVNFVEVPRWTDMT